MRGSRGLGSHQLGDRPSVDPRPQPVLQKVGGHQGQPPTPYLPHHHRHADQSEDDGQRHAHLGRADGGVAVCAVGDGAHRRHRHDLREGEPQQDLVLRLHVGRYFMFSHVFLSFLTSGLAAAAAAVSAARGFRFGQGVVDVDSRVHDRVHHQLHDAVGDQG